MYSQKTSLCVITSIVEDIAFTERVRGYSEFIVPSACLGTILRFWQLAASVSLICIILFPILRYLFGSGESNFIWFSIDLIYNLQNPLLFLSSKRWLVKCYFSLFWQLPTGKSFFLQCIMIWLLYLEYLIDILYRLHIQVDFYEKKNFYFNVSWNVKQN